MILSPICLFTYNRLSETVRTIEALQRNMLASESDLFIFSDGPKDESNIDKIKILREYLGTVSGFRSVKLICSDSNLGLANSIISGVSMIISEFGKVIVLEDDLVTSKNFLTYMNQALDFYMNNTHVYSIAGYTPPIDQYNDDVYFTKRASSWGWGTWSNRWNKIEWDLENYPHDIQSKKFKEQLNKMGSDMFKMLNDQLSGKINSWAIRWCLHQFFEDTFTVYPTISKVNNIGTGTNATHTKDRFNRFFTKLDQGDKLEFVFKNKVEINQMYLKQFLKQFSLYTRIKFKILNIFS